MKTNNHYYLFKGVRFENMKELCQGQDNMKAKHLRNLYRWGLLEKVEEKI